MNTERAGASPADGTVRPEFTGNSPKTAEEFYADQAAQPECEAPKCGKCGAEIGTAMMAAFCPRQNACEFWPEDEDGQRFIRWARGEIESPF